MTLVKLILDIKDSAWISANPTKLLRLNEPIYRNDGFVAFGDGVTPLSGLTFKPVFTGAVNSVNGQSGDVVITASDIDLSGYELKTRVYTTTSATTLTLDLDLYDEAELTALAGDVTIANPTGTRWDGRIIAFRLKDNGTARTITYGSDFVDLTGSAPTTTTISKVTLIAARWSASRSKWEIFASITES